MAQNNSGNLSKLFSAGLPKLTPQQAASFMTQVMASGEPGELKLVDVVRSGERISIPKSVTYDEAIENIERIRDYENELMTITEVIDTFPLDGAVAFKRAMDELFGAVFGKVIPGNFFSPPKLPTEINVDLDAKGSKISVPWGRFTFPGGNPDEEFLETRADEDEKGMFVFQITAQVYRRNQPAVLKLAALTRELVATRSIYRSKAFKIKFRDDTGSQIADVKPTFIDVTSIKPQDLIYRDDLMRAFETNVLTPLRCREAAARAGVPFKRGVLLAGPFGTGKTMAAYVTARVGTDNGVTFVYLSDVRELPEAISFAQRYAPAVIFAEDVDRATEGDRSVKLDKILNTLDGIDSKTGEVMVVLTTNHIEKINKAMLRPGRLDVILNVLPPDASAVIKLIQLYGRGQLHKGVNLARAGEMLNGQIPAVIREVVERSKLETIRRTGESFEKITAEDIEAAAYTVLQQQKLFEEPEAVEATPFEKSFKAIVREALEESPESDLISDTNDSVDRIRSTIGA